ncbi:hypothetical protein [Agromyces atrinae]|uniref:Uncharacterized protein n=1 Tax=Agromyces atrinae TaxID=592376 RepID=A0A4Q2M5J4_9MICO|nr:hypothetical protein [Agromyces atrinae]NYD66189.1 hypothetical protein [Agromyces atrinae]RXZ86527.1 hypothetical protein ESP50_08995 [Agromyces atrinae]
MTSEDPPLTRRELRERERQLAGKTATGTLTAQPAPLTAPTPVTDAGGGRRATVESTTRGGEAPTLTPPQKPAAPEAPNPAVSEPTPSPVSRFAPPTASTPIVSTDDRDEASGGAPERTLTRRELRALLSSNTASDIDDSDDTGGPSVGGSADRPVPAASTPAIDRVPAGNSATASTLLDEATPTTSPVGHWSHDMHVDDATRDEPFDQFLSRGPVPRSAMPTTTNALILPNLPEHLGGAGGPVTSEVMVTGSVDLPRGLGATGAMPSHIDSPDIDRLLDEVDDHHTDPTGAQPISAARAVSTQGPNRDVITPPKKEGMNVPLVLAVTAGILTIGVIGTLIVGYVLGAFQ